MSEGFEAGIWKNGLKGQIEVMGVGCLKWKYTAVRPV